MAKRFYQFDCQMYVATKGAINLVMPLESGPRRIIRLESVTFDKLIEPGFRSLLATFDSVNGQQPSVVS